MDFDDLLNRQMERMREDETIRCPACKRAFEMDECEGHVTIDGGEGAVEDDCPGCGAKLIVEELVIRSYEVTIKE